MASKPAPAPDGDHVELFLPDAEATERVGGALGRSLRRGDWVLLEGALGAGKSALARAAIRARLGRDEEIPSPTFTLVQAYEADNLLILHADLYRLGDPEEVVELGLAEAFETAIGFVEWPEKLGALAPARRLEAEMRTPGGGGEGRLLALKGVGGGWREALHAASEASGAAR